MSIRSDFARCVSSARVIYEKKKLKKAALVKNLNMSDLSRAEEKALKLKISNLHAEIMELYWSLEGGKAVL